MKIIKKTKEVRKKETKQNETNKERDIIRKRNEGNRELNHFERIQNRKNATKEEDIDLGRFFELTTSDKKIC